MPDSANQVDSNYTGNEVYLLEFFLPAHSEDDKSILTTVSLILGSMREKFKTLKLASGQELGEELSVEVVNFQNDQKSHSIQMIQAARFFLGEFLNILPSPEPLQNGEVKTPLDSSAQPSKVPLNNGKNVVTKERNIIVISSSDSPDDDGKGKTKERQHKISGVRIEISLDDIIRYSKMKRNNAAKELKGKSALPKLKF